MNEITPGDVSVRLGRNLKSRRVSQGLRLVDVSQRSGLSVPTIRAIERGDSSVSFGNYAFVAVMLGADDLFKSIFEDTRDSGSDLERSRVRVSKPKAMR
jgi:transcriptional regulator with XRE-family HTH domain